MNVSSIDLACHSPNPSEKALLVTPPPNVIGRIVLVLDRRPLSDNAILLFSLRSIASPTTSASPSFDEIEAIRDPRRFGSLTFRQSSNTSLAYPQYMFTKLSLHSKILMCAAPGNWSGLPCAETGVVIPRSTLNHWPAAC